MRKYKMKTLTEGQIIEALYAARINCSNRMNCEHYPFYDIIHHSCIIKGHPSDWRIDSDTVLFDKTNFEVPIYNKKE